MKKYLVLVTTLLMILVSAALAEGVDYSQIDYDTLVTMKTTIEAELRTRPESSPFELVPGVYTVGIDVKPGRYYIAASVPHDYNASLYVYATKDIYAQRPSGKIGDVMIRCFLKVGEEAKYIDLAEGNYFEIQSSPIKFSMFEFKEDDYFMYTPPEGTYVPAGKYVVGEDIPAGTYRVYAATINEGSMLVYKDTSTTNHVNLEDSLDIEVSTEIVYETARLSNGNYVEIDVDVIMKKQPTLSFD